MSYTPEEIELLSQTIQKGDLPPDFHLRANLKERYAENHPGGLLATGALASIVGFSLLGWMGAVGMSAIALQMFLNWMEKNRNDWDAIQDGTYAHLLTKPERKQYEQLYGKETYQKALKGDYRHIGIEPEQTEEKQPEPPRKSVREAIVATVQAVAPMLAPPVTTPMVTPVPDLSRYADVQQRMMVLLQAMAAGGFPIGTLLHHPFCWFWGRSQSGKTTAALMLGIARLAMGYQGSYFSTDSDYPQELPWQQTEDTPEGYAMAIALTAQTISDAQKGALREQFWLFDEMLMATGEHGIDITSLLRAVLAKGAKTGAAVIGISQADTSAAHGLKGLDTAWRNERVSVQALHVEDETGKRSPTGQYFVTRGEAIEEWSIPAWMLTERNEYGQFCPVVWMLKHFPELRIQRPVQPSSPPIQDPVQFNAAESGSIQFKTDSERVNWLNRLYQGSSSPSESINSADSIQFNSAETPKSDEEIRQRIVELKAQGKGQNDIIFEIWQAKPGGNKAYRDAVAEYKRILGEG